MSRVVLDADRGGVDPPYLHHDYVGTRLRAPKEPLVIVPATLGVVTAPAFGESAVEASDSDLTAPARRRRALGQRIVMGPRPRLGTARRTVDN